MPNIEENNDLPYSDKNVGSIDDFENDLGDVPELSDKQKQQFKNRYGNDMKPFRETAFGRTLAGRNKTGRMIHSVIDVLPVPNIHEVVKAVIKDADARNKAMGSYDLLKETFKRLDYFRTGIGVGLVVLYLLDYVSLEKAQRAFEFILSFV